jgi:hypothetical protein
MQSSCPTGPPQMAFLLPREAVSRGQSFFHLTKMVWGMPIAAAVPRRERFSTRRSLLHSSRSCSFWQTAYRLRTLPVAPPVGRARMVCVCFWPPVTKWGTVMHEIPISSAQLLTSLPYPRTQ